MKSFFSTLFLLLLININANSQIVFTGKITSAINTPIANASISVLNTSFNTISDSNGQFKIKFLQQGNYQLEINHVNFASILPKIAVDKINSNISIFIMEESINTLDELMVTAEKKEELLQKINWIIMWCY